jgi:hypothetical protein
VVFANNVIVESAVTKENDDYDGRNLEMMVDPRKCLGIECSSHHIFRFGNLCVSSKKLSATKDARRCLG